MEEVTKNSNDYVDKRKLLELNLQIWDQKHMSAPFDLQSFYHLLALIFYMGVVRLPCKTDFWKDDNTWPYHPIIHEMGMSRDRFTFLWINFHISSVYLSDVAKEQDDCYVGGNE